jgi:hypothetical protein
MASKTDEQFAKENRLRLFRDEGARAMEDAASDAIAIRKNMARLRGLTLAKEAEAASTGNETSTAKPVKSSNKKRK